MLIVVAALAVRTLLGSSRGASKPAARVPGDGRAPRTVNAPADPCGRRSNLDNDSGRNPGQPRWPRPCASYNRAAPVREEVRA